MQTDKPKNGKLQIKIGIEFLHNAKDLQMIKAVDHASQVMEPNQPPWCPPVPIDAHFIRCAWSNFGWIYHSLN